MKLKDALIAYNPGTDEIKVGPLIREGKVDWTEPYQYTMGAAHVEVRSLSGKEARLRAMSDFIGAVVRDLVDITAAHEAFLVIDEYRESLPEDMIPQE